MPLIDLTYPTGTIAAADRPQLVDALTTKLLHWEGAPDNEFFRSIACGSPSAAARSMRAANTSLASCTASCASCALPPGKWW